MRWRTLLSATSFTLLLSAPAGAQLPAAESRILEQASQTYGNLRRYLFQGVIHVDLRAEKPQSQQAIFLSATDGSGRIRDEVSGGPAVGMFVSDGRQTVIYNGSLGQYVRRSGGADSVLKNSPNRGVGSMLVSRYATLLTGATAIKRLPDEVLTVGGKPRTCDVLDVTYQPSVMRPQMTEDPRRYWIDRETHLVLRQRSLIRADIPQLGGKVEQEEVISFQRAERDPALPDSLWAFRPPEGAELVKEFKSPADPAAAFAGKPAMDFTLKDLKGRPHSLKSLRGKTVLLDFWATWCGPCRITMPQVAKIHTQYKNRGVEVMSINVGESAKKAGDYIAKNGYAFTTLLDEDREVSTRYRVNGIPTLVVIDARGNVSDYLVGSRDEAALKAALRKAGVK